MHKYDVVVVGAGPAGSVAARFAAENGASILLLERDREPGIPVRCAEGVHHFDLETYIELDERFIACTIDHARLHAPNNVFVDVYSGKAGYILERRFFDRALADRAVQAGALLKVKSDVTALLKEGDRITGVVYRENGVLQSVYADIVIAADGIESQLGKWAGINTTLSLRDVDVCVQYTLNNIRVDETCIEMYFGKKIAPGGYLWVFPKAKYAANVGLGIAGHLTSENPPQELLSKFIAERFPHASVSYAVYGGVPTSAGLKELVKDGFMLCGDAARQVNPATGGGIIASLQAGKLAGETAAQAIKSGDVSARNLRKYEKSWSKVRGKKQKLHYLFKNKFLFSEDDTYNEMFTLLSKKQGEKTELKDLFMAVLKNDPVLLAKLSSIYVKSMFL